MFKKIIVLYCIALIIIIAIETYYLEKNKPLCKNCNILLISLDTLAAKHLPCYGYDKDTAPNLCQFGKENFLFSNSYSQSYWTRPSQTSVLTGLHPTTHGMFVRYISKLDSKYKTITEILKSYGYKTYYFGPEADGDSWDESMVRGFDYMEQDIYKKGSLDHWQKALDILEENQKSKTPTFMYLHTYYVHAPYITGSENLKFVDQEDIKKYPEITLDPDGYYNYTAEMRDFVLSSLEDRVQKSGTLRSLQLNTEMLTKMKKAKTLRESENVFNTLPEYETGSYIFEWYLNGFRKTEQNKYAYSLYDEKINQLDTELKDFFSRIKDKFEKDTIVVIYSDHGETLGERGSYNHCSNFPDCLYMETVKVPLIIRVPGLRSKRIEELAQGIDIYPTIMKLIGKEGPVNLEGEDLVGLMRGTQEKSKKDYIISEAEGNNFMIIDREWSLYVKNLYKIDSDQLELYDLINDKNQLVNVAKKYPGVVSERIYILKKYMLGEEKNIKTKYDFPDWLDETKKEKLIKEGYF